MGLVSSIGDGMMSKELRWGVLEDNGRCIRGGRSYGVQYGACTRY
jgi:hypothetical protein